MEFDLSVESIPIIHALDSETRLKILNLLAQKSMTSSELAAKLYFSKAIISKHVKILKDAGLVYDSTIKINDSRKKLLCVKSDSFVMSLPEKIYPAYKKKKFDVTLGNYFAVNGIEPTCGLASYTNVIGTLDDPRIFYMPERFTAELIWFSKGQIEYNIPNPFPIVSSPEMLDISLEFSSEFPGANNRWPSDISFWINDKKIGFWQVSGNYFDVRGKLTPKWWRSDFSQYGVLKHLRINKNDSSVDGIQISPVSLKDLDLNQETLRFRIGIDPESEIQGGLTLFGRHFGNHPQDIKISAYYSVPN